MIAIDASNAMDAGDSYRCKLCHVHLFIFTLAKTGTISSPCEPEVQKHNEMLAF